MMFKMLSKRSKSSVNQITHNQISDPMMMLTTPTTFPAAKDFDFIERDSQYLLRLCQNRKWSSIERCCKIFIQAMWCDESLRSKVRQQILQKDNWGNTPLHIVCYYKPRHSVVKGLLHVAKQLSDDSGGSNSNEITKINLCTMTNDKGESPLIISCKAGAGQDTIRVLIPNSIISVCDHRGISAFQGLLNRYAIIQRIPALRDRYVQLKDMKKEDQLMYDYDKKDNIDDDLSSIVMMDDMTGDEWSSSSSSSSSSPVFGIFWCIMEDMMYEAWNRIHSSSSSSPFQADEYDNACFSHLNGAALVAGALPKEITDMILRLHGSQQPSSSSTPWCLQPLHLAFTRQIASYHPKARIQHAYFVRKLIKLNPSVAKSKFPGSSSRTLFCQAIATGNYWSLDYSHVIDDYDGSSESNDESKVVGPVQVLFNYHPDALTHPDTETGLYPFMLAAAAAAAATPGDVDGRGGVAAMTGQQQQNDDDRLALDTIYNLLRAAPDSIINTTDV